MKNKLFAFLALISSCLSHQASGISTVVMCNGNPVTITAPQGASYLWSNGDTAQSTTVNAQGNYVVVVTDAVGGSYWDTTVVVKETIAMPKIRLFNKNVCDGDSTLLQLKAPTNLTGLSFVWNHNGTPIAGATSVNYWASVGGDYSITLTGSGGCNRTSAVKTLTVKPNPNPSVTIVGSSVICPHTSVELQPSHTDNIRWFHNGSQLQNPPTVLHVNLPGSYTLGVKENGCYAVSAPVTVTSHPAYTPSVITVGNTRLCEGDDLILSVNNVMSGYSYQWFWADEWYNQATPTPVSSSSTFTATPSYSGNQSTMRRAYLVVATDAYCSIASAEKGIIMDKNEPAIITPLGSTTIGAGAEVALQANYVPHATYQWYRDNMPIPTANKRKFKASVSGDYSVIITSKNGCISASAPVTVTQTGLKESTMSVTPALDEEQSFELVSYPNPVQGQLTFSTRGLEQTDAMVYVFDINGKLMTTRVMKQNTISIDMSSYPAGLYLIRYKDVEGRAGTLKVTKLD